MYVCVYVCVCALHKKKVKSILHSLKKHLEIIYFCIFSVKDKISVSSVFAFILTKTNT